MDFGLIHCINLILGFSKIVKNWRTLTLKNLLYSLKDQSMNKCKEAQSLLKKIFSVLIQCNLICNLFKFYTFRTIS